MAHNRPNPIVRNKTIIQEILSADPQYILDKVREKELITGREYTKLKTSKGDAEDLVIKLVDTINNKGVQTQTEFIEVLQDKIVLGTYPDLKDVEWGDSGTASSSSLKRSAERSLSKDAPESQKTVTEEATQPSHLSDNGGVAGSQQQVTEEPQPGCSSNREDSGLQEDKYLLTSKPTGLCVIINNENFQKAAKRSGTEKDVESLATVFSWLGFQVLMCQDLKASDMASVTKLLADLKDLAGLQNCKLKEWSKGRFTPLSVLPRHGDAFVCCVLSHGKEDVVDGIDGEKRHISDITSAFNGEHCSALLGKPKVFIIQACQGHSLQPGLAVDDCIHQKEVKEDYHPIEADFLVSISTVAKYQALRDSSGSFFIQSLCEQLRQGCARGEDILKILVRVNADVSKKSFGKKDDPEKVLKQMPEVRKVTLRHNLVFSPCSS